MKTKIPLLLFSGALTLASCFTNPITGRRGLSLVSEQEMLSMGTQQYASFLTENRPVAKNGSRDAEMVQRVGVRIANAVQTYLQSVGQQQLTDGYQWEFNLVNSNEANAWCMPGGKVVVYSGLLPLTQNEAGLAIVMGHEIAHAIARHGNERMSQQMAVQLGGVALSTALSTKPAATQNIFLTAFGVGSQLGTLKYARTQESEADRMGLIFAALAGYNPREAIPFWQRMASGGGQKPPELLSTHPSDETRIANIERLMPEALKYYRPQGGTNTASPSRPGTPAAPPGYKPPPRNAQPRR
jgi:predicted Zn-dependent protease